MQISEVFMQYLFAKYLCRVSSQVFKYFKSLLVWNLSVGLWCFNIT